MIPSRWGIVAVLDGVRLARYHQVILRLGAEHLVAAVAGQAEIAQMKQLGGQ